MHFLRSAFTLSFVLVLFSACAQTHSMKTTDDVGFAGTAKPSAPATNPANWNKLSEAEEYVIVHKGTDRPYTGEYTSKKDAGMYVCRRCNAPLYSSKDKFDSHCGWPSFDDEVKGSVKKVPDADGSRVEIICNNCQAHLGHVFNGEGFTAKNTRHCVNTTSLRFVPAGEK